MSDTLLKNKITRSVYKKMNACLDEITLSVLRSTLSVFRSTSKRFLDSKIKGFKHPEVFEDEDMAEHFAHEYLGEIASQNVVKGYIISRIEFIENALGQDQVSHDTFIDIGDPDGIFIKSLGKTELSANISHIAANNVHKKGIESIRCDVEHLPLKTKSVDNILFFQIFEHLPNPISALHELNRVAAKSIILSIPYVSKTNIHRYNYDPSRLIFEHHIFEFDDNDFRQVITHTGLDIQHHEIVTVLTPVTFKEQIIFLFWNSRGVIRKDPEYGRIHDDLFYGCFKKFSIYHLTKKAMIP